MRKTLFVVSGPSGAGIPDILAAIYARREDVCAVTPVTARKMKPGEQNGVGFWFYDLEGWQALQESGDLLESTVLAGNDYGLPPSRPGAAGEGPQRAAVAGDRPGGPGPPEHAGGCVRLHRALRARIAAALSGDRPLRAGGHCAHGRGRRAAGAVRLLRRQDLQRRSRRRRSRAGGPAGPLIRRHRPFSVPIPSSPTGSGAPASSRSFVRV